MRFNASQLQKILDENVNDYGANKLIEFVFNSLMKLERQAFMAENKSSNNKGNGYRSRCFSSLSGINSKFRATDSVNFIHLSWKF